jgi:uncharacterized protein (TIGR03067 family)
LANWAHHHLEVSAPGTTIMPSRTLVTLLATLFVGFAACSKSELSREKAAEKTKSDYEREYAALEGTWKVESITYEGQAEPELVGSIYEFAEDQVSMQTPTGKVYKFEFTLLLPGSGENQIRSQPLEEGISNVVPAKSIYKIEGERLTICASEAKQPVEFSSQKGSPQRLTILRRVKDVAP